MAVRDPQHDLRAGISGGADVWDDGLAGVLLTVDYFQVSTGSSSWTIAPSGNISFVGTVSITLQKNIVITPSGNIVLSGTSPITFGNGSNTVTYFPTGTVVFSGTTEFVNGRAFISNGTVTFSGNTSFIHGHQMGVSGDITFGGSPIITKTKMVFPSGILVFSGTAPMSFNGSGTTGTSTRLTLTFVGN